MEKNNKIVKAEVLPPEKFTPDQVVSKFRDLRRELGKNFLEIGLLIKSSNDGKIWEKLNYDSLGEFIEDVVGVSERTGYDLMSIADKWSRVLPPERIQEISEVGWTKMRALCPVINVENISSWESKAKSLKLRQLKDEIKKVCEKKDLPGDSEGEEVRTFTFKMVGGQINVVERALETAAKMTDNGKRNVQLDAICAEFIATYEGQENA